LIKPEYSTLSQRDTSKSMIPGDIATRQSS